jgi:hypothetical protein
MKSDNWRVRYCEDEISMFDSEFSYLDPDSNIVGRKGKSGHIINKRFNF